MPEETSQGIFERWIIAFCKRIGGENPSNEIFKEIAGNRNALTPRIYNHPGLVIIDRPNLETSFTLSESHLSITLIAKNSRRGPRLCIRIKDLEGDPKQGLHVWVMRAENPRHQSKGVTDRRKGQCSFLLSSVETYKTIVFAIATPQQLPPKPKVIPLTPRAQEVINQARQKTPEKDE